MIFALLLGLVLFIVSVFFVYRAADSEKISSYECGFNP